MRPIPTVVSIQSQIRHAIASATKYWRGHLPEDVTYIITKVAANEAISERVIQSIETKLHLMRRKFFKLALIALLIAEIPIQGLKVMGKGHLLGQDQLNGQGLPNIIVIWELAAIYFLITFRVWRQENRMGRIAGNLVDALKAGIDFRRNETDESLRDRFASLVQRAALTYRNVFRYSEGTSFFKAQVRRKARSCSAHIMTLVPGIVTAGAQEIDQINEDLARLIIRSQTGYWHQTGDIAKHGAALTRPNTIRLGFLGFIKDRAVQIASLTLVAALLSAALAALLPLLLKHS